MRSKLQAMGCRIPQTADDSGSFHIADPRGGTTGQLLYTATIPLFANHRSLGPAKHPFPCPRNLQYTRAIRIWTCNESIGRHPIVGMGFPLLRR